MMAASNKSMQLWIVSIVAFPCMVLPLAVAQTSEMQLIQDAAQNGHLLGLLTTKEPAADQPLPCRMYDVGNALRDLRA